MIARVADSACTAVGQVFLALIPDVNSWFCGCGGKRDYFVLSRLISGFLFLIHFRKNMTAWFVRDREARDVSFPRRRRLPPPRNDNQGEGREKQDQAASKSRI
ncbi:hypothetical protein [Nitrobacter sp.]|jgi:hypothetical protein|uniref:hypothetical protein n=1 Tax=Nitrobacter sp. TaxID=29420 RepID=UPI0029CAB018|nr:hypothetical protein [Nitrobacter sp.]